MISISPSHDVSTINSLLPKEFDIKRQIPLNIHKPPALDAGATIGIIAPASPFKRMEFEAGLAVLQEMGYRVRLASGLFERRGYLAGDDRHRATQFMTMWHDSGVDAVMCARGGYGSLRILPYLDPIRLAARPLPFIGFSDITALHQQLVFGAAMAAYHGPTVCALGVADEQTRESLFQALTDKGGSRILARNLRMVQPGRAEGILVGGNLTTLCHLLGTPFDAGYAGGILFLEDRGEAPYRIDRMLVQMKLAGCFDGLAGLLLGSFQDCGKDADILSIVTDIFSEMAVPIGAGLAVGHQARNLTLPIGASVILDANEGDLILRAFTTRCEASLDPSDI